MKLTDLNEAKALSVQQKTALRVLKDFDKFTFNNFVMTRGNGALTKAVLAVFKDGSTDDADDVEDLLDDLNADLLSIKSTTKNISDLIKFRD